MAKVVLSKADVAVRFWPIYSAAIGAFVGVFAWGISVLLSRFFFSGLCDGAADCFESRASAGYIAVLFSAVFGVIFLALFKLPRALFVAGVAAFATWGVQGWLWGLWWLEALLWSALLYGLVYVLLTTIALMKRWALVVLVTLLALIAIKIILMLYL